MARLTAPTGEQVYSIRSWLGLNQHPEGDTKLKYGEAAIMENWRVTRSGNLQRRPGTAVVETLGEEPVRCLWSGRVADRECVLAVCAGTLYRLFDGADWRKETLGAVASAGDVSVFGFGKNAYILDGETYRVYDGETLQVVEGYRPLVVTAAEPAGGGTVLESVNKLSPSRRVRFSPSGGAVDFVLPEQKIQSVDYAKDLATGTDLSGYTVDEEKGIVHFTAAPTEGVNRLEIGYTVSGDDRLTVERMSYGEIYNGSQDSRVFLYGDGSNQALYSGLDESGQPRADYFPDLNVMAVGESNTPITAMIRHGSRMMVYKTNGAYSVYYNSLTLADGSVTAGFYVTPVNRTLGNAAPGQAQLVLNHPRTLCGQDCYEWKNNSVYLTADEREAKRISDRVQTTLALFDLSRCRCWDDNDHQEYYICSDKRALVHNYAADVWYYYTNFDARALMNFRGELYLGTGDGRVLRFSELYRTDCGEPIEAYWESGSMDCRADHLRKYTSMLWLSIKPESHSHVAVTVQTDRKSDFGEKVIAMSMNAFENMDFSAFSFNTSSRPQTRRLRIKAKKYAFYKLIFRSYKPDTTATVLSADIRVRQTGYTK